MSKTLYICVLMHFKYVDIARIQYIEAATKGVILENLNILLSLFW